MHNWFKEITLEGQNIKLEPLMATHRDGLLAAATDGTLWDIWYTSVPSAHALDDYIAHALSQKEKGIEYPFVVINKADDRIIGCTRYYGATPEHKRLEIGYTWYAKSFQRTGVNTQCKYLLLSYAFEQMNCIAVQFMTDWHNQKSREAIARIGAKQDGILRNHRINLDGSYRDSVVFSITNTEWVTVKTLLEDKMAKSY